MTVGTSDFSRYCFDEGLRIAWIVPVGAMGGESPCDDIEEWLYEEDFDKLIDVFPALIDADLKSADNEELMAWLQESRIEGFVVKVERQIRKYIKNTGSYSAGWNEYTSVVFHVETLDELPAKIQAWHDRLVAKDKKVGAK